MVENRDKEIIDTLNRLYFRSCKHFGIKSFTDDIPLFDELLLRFSPEEIISEMNRVKKKAEASEVAKREIKLKKERNANLEKLKSENMEITVYVLTVKNISFGCRCESFDVKTMIFTDKHKACQKAYELTREWTEQNHRKSVVYNNSGKYFIKDYEDSTECFYGPAFETYLVEKIVNFNNEIICSSSSGW